MENKGHSGNENTQKSFKELDLSDSFLSKILVTDSFFRRYQLTTHSLPAKKSVAPNLTTLLSRNSDFSITPDSLESILKSKPFRSIMPIKTFSNFQIFAHEKGNPKAFHYFYNFVNNEITTKKISPGKFNSLFKQIKKSRSKNFQVTNFPDGLLDNLGTFLAKEVDGKISQLIFILSRNGFLAPGKDEVNLFDHLSNSISPFLKFFFLNQLATEEYSRKICALTNINAVGYSLNNLHYAKTFNPGLIDFSKISPLFISQIKGLFVYFLNDTPLNNISDVYQYQRISLLGELLNTLKHELSNPLFAIQLASKYLSENKTDEKAQFFLEISKSAERCLGLIDNFSELYSPNNAVKEVNILNVIQEIITLSKSETKTIIKEVIPVGDIDKFTIMINPIWMSQILFNLIINAAHSLHASQLHQKKICIMISIINDILTISVSDNGPGIHPDVSLHIFEPFFTTKTDGNGLGLSICKGLAQKMSGNLRLNCSTSTKTEFIIEIPITPGN